MLGVVGKQCCVCLHGALGGYVKRVTFLNVRFKKEHISSTGMAVKPFRLSNDL